MPAFSSRSISEPALAALPAAARRRAALGLAAGAAILALAGCASTKSIPQPTAKHLEYAQRNGQVTSLETLMHGRSLYVTRCSACHRLHKPREYFSGRWPKLVADMVKNAEINDAQRRDITEYLVAVAAVEQDSIAALSRPIPRAPAASAPAQPVPGQPAPAPSQPAAPAP